MKKNNNKKSSKINFEDLFLLHQLLLKIEPELTKDEFCKYEKILNDALNELFSTYRNYYTKNKTFCKEKNKGGEKND